MSITAATGSGPYRCGNRIDSGSVRHAGFQADRIAQQRRIDPQQHQIRATGIEPVRRQVHLLRRRQMDESDISAKTPVAARRAPWAANQSVALHICSRAVFYISINPACPFCKPRTGETRHTGKRSGNKAGTKYV